MLATPLDDETVQVLRTLHQERVGQDTAAVDELYQFVAKTRDQLKHIALRRGHRHSSSGGHPPSLG